MREFAPHPLVGWNPSGRTVEGQTSIVSPFLFLSMPLFNKDLLSFLAFIIFSQLSAESPLSFRGGLVSETKVSGYASASCFLAVYGAPQSDSLYTLAAYSAPHHLVKHLAHPAAI